MTFLSARPTGLPCASQANNRSHRGAGEADSTVRVCSVPSPPMTPQDYGVGARFTLSVYDSDYVRIILDALAGVDTDGLVVDTGDISTYVTGPEQRVLEYLRDVTSAAAAEGVHVSVAILLSRGCPGELQCALPPGVAALGADQVSLGETGQRARAHWSLYPLLDERPGGPPTSAATEHMGPIYAAIDRARAENCYSGSDHYATRLDGDLGQVLQTAANAWISVGATVQHVVTHLTVSLNSPTSSDR